MKRAILPALMISLLLTGCGNGGAAERALEARRDTLAAAAEISFTAKTTAFFGDEVFDCTLDCVADPETVTVEVAAPDMIAGVRATVRNGETTLHYETVSLPVGHAGAEEPGPLSAMPVLVRALREGHVIRAWEETREDMPLIAAELYADDVYGLTMWFDAKTLSPVAASLRSGEAEKVKCEISKFNIKET